jgi:hypothetical protein
MKYVVWPFALVLALFVLPAAHAAWPPPANDTGIDYSDPKNWPNDPGYGGQWNYWSFVPSVMRAQVDQVSRTLGTGMHIDRAWAKTIGDPRVIEAVTDSGIEWNEGELTNRLFLNQGELPPPMGCPGSAPGKYDVNGDGRFNVLDYTTTTGHNLAPIATVCDPRIHGDSNNNGILDPQDLIRAFSDGKDDDGNGYVDDISGWDFFHDDNDPMDDTGFGHGTGSTKDGAAEGNDGRGDIGVCPECTAMMLRVGDAFVPELNTWAMAVTYATDIGASVINISGGGGLDNPSLSNEAMEYAYKNGVTIIASNSDLDSFHHNYPNTSQHAISVHAIRYDSSSLNAATTFFNYNTCTNYGAQLMLSIPATGCSSEAAGRSGGLSALLYSAALQAGLPAVDARGIRHLTAEEVRQIYIETADNFYDPADTTDPTKYPTIAPQPNGLAFARRFGYGRPNARRAVDAIFAGALPPEVDIRAPGWFDVVYPDKTPSVMINVHLGWHGGALPAGTTLDWVIEWAPGVDPTDDLYKPIGHAEMQPTGDVMAAWDVSSLTVNNPVPLPSDPNFQPDDPANKYVVTLRARALLHSSNPVLDGVKGESRHAVSVYKDPDLVAGFPIFLGSSGEGSPKVADLLGDGKREIVYADSAGRVHAIKADATELAGFPVTTPAFTYTVNHAMAPAFTTGGIDAKRYAPAGATPAIGDIDGDGKPEIVVATWFGDVVAWHTDGSKVSGFPVSLDRDTLAVAIDQDHELQDGFFASPVLVDLDKDKKLEIVAAGMDGKLYAWHGDGSKVANFPVVVHDPNGSPQQRQRIMGTPAVGDLNGDGVPDIVVGSNEDYSNVGRLYAVDGKSGAFLSGWPLSLVSNHILPVVGKGVPCAPAMVDINGDGVPEVMVSGIGSVLRVYDAKGKPFGAPLVNQKEKYGSKSNARNPIEFMMVASPAVGDLDNDGTPDLIEGGAGSDALLAFATGGQRHDFEHHVGAWDGKSGKFKNGFPQVIEDWQFFSHPAVADLDGDGKPEVIAPSAGYFVHAWNVDGAEPKGFPKYTGGWALATPAVGDLDGDGKLELVQMTRNGRLYAWHTDGKAKGRIDWASYHHDLQNTGNFGTLLDEGTRATPGCGCQLGAVPEPAPLGVILLVAFFMLLVHDRRGRWR